MDRQFRMRLFLLAVVALLLAAVGGNALEIDANAVDIDPIVFGRVVGFHW